MAIHVLTEGEIAESPEITLPTDGTAGDDIAARRKAAFDLFDRSREGGEGVLDLTKATMPPAEAREPIDSVTLQTSAGEIEFGPPPGVSLTMRLAIMLGDENPNRIAMAMLRTCMCVRSIDGARVTPITSKVEAQHLANILGDQLLDQLFQVYVDTWPVAGGGDLQVLRKNKRVT